MDVVCGRCRAEYEFDDALISTRGTTVRCTNCGLQFKVFPPAGQRPPDVWRLFAPGELEQPCAQYATLGRLQKAIARGEVSARHLLSRGSAPPRALFEIAELEPLLKQPRSERPPNVTERRDEAPAPVDPAGSPPAASEDRETPFSDPGEEIVPASMPPGGFDEDLPGDVSPEATVRSHGEKPRIRSALSMSPVFGLISPPWTHEKQSSTISTAIAPRTPLRSALQTPPEREQTKSTTPQHEAWEAPSELESGSAIPASSAGSLKENGNGKTYSDLDTESPLLMDEPDPVPPSATRSVPPSSGRRPRRGSATSAADSEILRGPAEEPQHLRQEEAELPRPEKNRQQAKGPTLPGPETTSQRSLGTSAQREVPPPQHSPQRSAAGRGPAGPGRYRTASTEPISSAGALPSTRRARSMWIVLAVIASSAAFVILSNREKLRSHSPLPNADTVERGNTEALAAAQEALRQAEVRWLSAWIQGASPPPADPSLVPLVEDTPTGVSWELVDALRIAGQLGRARTVAKGLGTADGAYSLAMLDVAEAKEDAPWPVVRRRLREAATGEKPPYLARSALIYALATSGRTTQAQVEFQNWSRLEGAKDSPLYSVLRALIEQPRVSQDAADAAPLAAGTGRTDQVIPVQETRAPTKSNDVPAAKAEGRSNTSLRTASLPDPTTSPQQAVPSMVQKKINLADELWRGGNRDAALRLYREVVAEIGTSHFLGVRADSRIQQAEREKKAMSP